MIKSLPIWNVYHYNINAKTFEAYNVYSHGGFLRDLIEMRKIRNIKVFEKELHRSVIRYFWAKCEYELLLAEWPLNEKNPNYKKVDIAEMLKMNWEVFVKYTYSVRKNFVKE